MDAIVAPASWGPGLRSGKPAVLSARPLTTGVTAGGLAGQPYLRCGSRTLMHGVLGAWRLWLLASLTIA
jgi:hypothetical protein